MQYMYIKWNKDIQDSSNEQMMTKRNPSISIPHNKITLEYSTGTAVQKQYLQIIGAVLLFSIKKTYRVTTLTDDTQYNDSISTQYI